MYARNRSYDAMQNRYFGDVGDFAKYGLLRWLIGCRPGAAGPPLRLGVHWYLVPDESGGGDGKFTGFLDAPERFKACDPDLFAFLATSLLSPGSNAPVIEQERRNVSVIEQSPMFPEGTTFYRDVLDWWTTKVPIARRKIIRQEWLEKAYRRLGEVDVCFLDPDNGLQVKSYEPHEKKGPKYVFFEELDPLYRSGASLVVYQHVTRQGSAQEQCLRRIRALAAHTGCQSVFAVRWSPYSPRAFFIVPQPKHEEVLRMRAESLLDSPWGKHFALVEAG